MWLMFLELFSLTLLVFGCVRNRVFILSTFMDFMNFNLRESFKTFCQVQIVFLIYFKKLKHLIIKHYTQKIASVLIQAIEIV